MKLPVLLTVSLLTMIGCTHKNSISDHNCINYDVFGPYDHSCPHDKHGPCPFCTPEQQYNINLADL